MLLKAAKAFERLDKRLARETYLDALRAATSPVAWPAALGVHEAAIAARAVLPAPEPPRATDLFSNGLAALITEGHAAGSPLLKRAVSAFRRDDIFREDGLRWLWLEKAKG